MKFDGLIYLSLWFYQNYLGKEFILATISTIEG